MPLSGARRLSKQVTIATQTMRRRRPPKFQPLFEVLEDRITPSTFTTVTSVIDNIGSSNVLGTFRYAVAHVTAGDNTIDFAFPDALAAHTIVLFDTISISSDLTITGLGADKLTISGN